VLFLTGKTASVAAIALIAGSYLWPDAARPVAVAVLVVLAVINMTGIRSTATVSVVIVSIVLLGLGAALGVASASFEPVSFDLDAGWYGILQSAGLLFFCFAGYARMATLGEEVVNPRRTLPRAILIALAITLVVYAAVGIACLAVLGADELSTTASPIAAMVGGAADPMVRVVAGVACLGSLIGILAALSRTAMAMGRERDLPGPLARVSERTRSPIVAEAVVAIVAVVAVIVLEPARLVGYSSCAVLCYYAIAHASALRQPTAERWLPRWVQVLGAIGCVALALMLPWQAIVATALVLIVAVVARSLALRTVKG
jgi:APA family basic amino acid/polyamine antiporter